MPFINRFWAFLRDEKRERRGLHSETSCISIVALSYAVTIGSRQITKPVNDDFDESVGSGLARYLVYCDKVFASKVEAGYMKSSCEGAAGVILKVDELTSKWRRSMVDVR
ncbi:hypothetical protein BU15DRAFT_68898 [Melanogaster broomeanus]|nr:hypothetical protein BU15DRAFT_68898 [Melanogaster broomeanus]